MMTVQFYNYLVAVEVQPQSVCYKFTRARYSFDRCCTTSETVRDQGQILQIRDCPGDSGTVGAYACIYNSDDATMQTVTILNSHYITEGQYVAIIARIIMYKDETGHISSKKPHCSTTMGK